MSRKEREERMRAAAPGREAYLAQQAASQAGKGKVEAMATWKVVLGATVLVAVVGGGYAAFKIWVEPLWDRHDFKNQHGAPSGSAFGDGVVAVFDYVTIERNRKDELDRNVIDGRTRVTIFETASGAEVGMELVDDVGHGCAPAVAGSGRIWCDLGTPAVHDARTFKRIATLADALAQAGAGKAVYGRWTVAGGMAYQLLTDGRVAVVDGATMSVRLADSAPVTIPDGGRLGTGGCSGGSAVGWKVEQAGGEMRAKVRRKGGAAPTETFLQPEVLGSFEGAALIVHHTSVERVDDHDRLSKLRDDGSAAWTVDLRGHCENWKLEGTNLVVVSDHHGSRIWGIDVGTGEIRWKQD